MRIKGLMVGLVALGVLALGVANASAQTIKPAGGFTAGASTVALVSNSPVNCGATNVAGTLNAAGNGSTSSIALSNCRDRNTNLGVTVTANTQWKVAIAPSSGGVTTTFSNVSLHVAYPAALNCSYDAVGSAAVPNAGTTISAWNLTASTGSPLTIKNVTAGCGLLGLGANPTAHLGGTLTLGTPITVTA
jgi:hypothetical protein